MALGGGRERRQADRPEPLGEVGVVVGRWTWTLFAEQLGILPDPMVPLLAVLIAVPSALFLANLIAVVPGRLASRTPPAIALRSE